MRIVTTPDFCNVCLEGLWLHLLKRVDLIDDVVTDCVQDAKSGEWKRSINAHLVPLAQFRERAIAPSESYEITWSKNGKVLKEFANQTFVLLDDENGPGTYTLNVTLSTEEVRVDKEHLLSSGAHFTINKSCSV